MRSTGGEGILFNAFIGALFGLTALAGSVERSNAITSLLQLTVPLPAALRLFAPATLGVALFWTIFGLLAAALVCVIRFFHVAVRALEQIDSDH
jgi:hypothetical protein